MTHKNLDLMYKSTLDFIDKDKFLDLCEQIYEAGYRDAGGTLPEEFMYPAPGTIGSNVRNPFYGRWLEKKYKSIAEVLRRKQP